MINHSTCDHPRTSAARAKCRKARANGEEVKTKEGASEKEVDFKGSGGAKAQTPGFKDLECHVCGVERIIARGTDPLDGIVKYVGERCIYYIKRDPNWEYVNF